MGKNDVEELIANLEKAQRGIDETIKRVNAQNAVTDEIKRQVDLFNAALRSLVALIEQSDKKNP